MRTCGWAIVLFAAIAAEGCQSYSTSSYAVAAGFAAVAGAAQIAEAAGNQATGAPASSGSATTAIPASSATAPSPLVMGSIGSPTSAPASPPLAPLPAPAAGAGSLSIAFPGSLCRPQLAILCFAGMQPVCVTDPRGCEICSCTPVGRFDWPYPR